MRYIAILILLSSCSANWHLKQAKKKGVIVNTETKIEYDTFEIKKVKDSIIYKKQVDTLKLKANCDSLLNGNPEAVAAIQEEVCPDIEHTVTLKIPVTVNDSTYYIDVLLVLKAKGGDLYAHLHNESPKIIYEKAVTNTTEVKPQTKIPWWIYAIGLVLCFLVVYRRL